MKLQIIYDVQKVFGCDTYANPNNEVLPASKSNIYLQHIYNENTTRWVGEPSIRATIEIYNANTLSKVEADSPNGILFKNGSHNKDLTFINGSIMVTDLDDTSLWSVAIAENTKYNSLNAVAFTPDLSNPVVKLYVKPTVTKKFIFFNENNVALSGKSISIKIYKDGSNVPFIDTIVTAGTYTTPVLYDGNYTYEIESDGYDKLSGVLGYNNDSVNIKFTVYIPFTKTFVYHNGKYKKYEKEWLVVSDELPPFSQFSLEGIEDLSKVPFNELEGAFELLTCSDKPGVQVNYQVDGYRNAGYIFLKGLNDLINTSDLQITSTEPTGTSISVYLFTGNITTSKVYTVAQVNAMTRQDFLSIANDQPMQIAFKMETTNPDARPSIKKISVNRKEYIVTPSIQSLWAELKYKEERKPLLYISTDNEETWALIEQDKSNNIDQQNISNFILKIEMSPGQELYAIAYSWT